jgi:hypothetical protein
MWLFHSSLPSVWYFFPSWRTLTLLITFDGRL